MTTTDKRGFWQTWGPLLGNTVFTLVVVGVIVGLGVAGWPGAPDNCVDGSIDTCYCEKLSGKAIEQPWSTWSNLAFIVVGSLILLQVGLDRRRGAHPRGYVNPMANGGWFAAVFGTVVSFMGPGSMFFHASMTEWGSVLDNMSMILFTAFVFWYDISRISGTLHQARSEDTTPPWQRPLRWSLAFGLTVLLLTGLNALIGQIPVARGYAPFLFLLTCVAMAVADVWAWAAYRRSYLRLIGYENPGNNWVSRWFHRNRKYRSIETVPMRSTTAVLVPLGLFAVALFVWIGAHTGGFLCKEPTEGFTGHAVWHVLSALAIGGWFYYFRWETTHDGPAPLIAQGKWGPDHGNGLEPPPGGSSASRVV